MQSLVSAAGRRHPPRSWNGPAPITMSPQVAAALRGPRLRQPPAGFDADEIGIRWRRTACTQSVCPVQAAPDQGSCLVKLGPAGYS